MRMKFLTVLAAVFAAFSASAAFSYKAEITVSGYSGATALANFPVLVRISPARIDGFSYARCQADGKDIQFTSPDGETVYPHDIDTWDAGGESLVWVNLPSLSGTDTKFLFWFGDAELTVQPDESAAWRQANDGFYAAVYHFDEEIDADHAETTYSADAAKHSSDYVLDAQPVIGKNGDYREMVSRDGVIGRGRVNSTKAAYCGNGLQCIPYCGTKLKFGISDTFTVSSWYNLGAKAMTFFYAYCTYAWGIQNGTSGTTIDIYGGTSSPKTPHFCPAVQPTLDEWFLLTVVFQGTTVSCYTNGVFVSSGTIGNAATTCPYETANLGLQLGNTRGAGHYSLNGAYDETRFLSNAASADWVKAEYETAKVDDYLTYGVVQKAQSDSLIVTATPELYCGDAISPAYGTVTTFSEPILFSAPDADQTVNDTLHVSFRGWELQRQDADGNWNVVDSAVTNAYRYVHTKGCNDKFVWKIIRRYPIALTVSPTGAGSYLVDGVATPCGTIWTDEGAAARTIQPVAKTGFDFLFWGGTRYGSTATPISVSPVANEMTTVVATFLSNGEGHTPQTVGWVGAADGLWTDGANWSCGTAPEKGDTVCLTNDTVRTIYLDAQVPRYAKFVISNATLVVSNWLSRVSADDILIGNKGTVKIVGALFDNAMSNRIWLAGDTLTVAQGGALVADGAGYAAANGPGWAGKDGVRGRTPCGVYGGAYGGTPVEIEPNPYGSAEFPEQPGTGAGRHLADNPSLGAGGGAIRLDFTGDVVIDGTISAKATKNAESYLGSGGAICLACRTVSGSGTVDAGSSDPASTVRTVLNGGGGRVAVRYDAAAQSNIVSKVVFSAFGGVAGDQIGSKTCVRGSQLLNVAYPRSAQDGVFVTDPGTLYFTDNQFLFAPAYREMGLPFGGTWMSGESLTALDFDGDLALTNACLRFEGLERVNVSGDLILSGTGYFARRNYGLILENADLTVGGDLVATGARLEMRGGTAKIAGDVRQDPLSGNGNGGVTTAFAGGEIDIKAMPTNAPASYGVVFKVAGTWRLGEQALVCPYCDPTNGAVAFMQADRMTMDATASIDAAEKGWEMNAGPGCQTAYGGIGSSYGGLGSANSSYLQFVRPVYGSERRPVNPGSGGFTSHSYAGFDGGGVVMLEVYRDFVFDGLITADGSTAAVGKYACGSSGGTINVRAGRLTGTTGRFSAQGGFAGAADSTGKNASAGGGRIAIRCGETTWTDAMKASSTCVLPGGTYGDLENYQEATSGTVYWGTWSRGLLLILR